MALPELPRSRDQAGFGIVEVLVSALVMLISLVAFFSVLDTQQATSATNRNASTAASLAEDDQERLRGTRLVDAAGTTSSRTVDVGGLRYSVSSTVEWIRDDTGGAQGCANSSNQADYLRLTSTVAGSYMRKPVVLRTLVAAPVSQRGDRQGTIGVALKDSAGQALTDKGVSISGPLSRNATTNSTGCAVFNYVPTGTYGVTVNASGLIDTSGTSPATSSATASAGTVSAVDVAVDQPAGRTVSFVTKLLSSTGDTAASVGALSAANAKVPGCPSNNGSCSPATPGFRLYTSSPAGALVTSLSATQLFPFTDAYAFYAGSCVANDPSKYVANYYTSGGHQNSQVLAPASTGSIQVRVPALNLKLKKATGTKWHVVARSADTGCTASYRFPEVVATAQQIQVQRGLPFGTWTVCVDDGTNRRTINAASAIALKADTVTTETNFDFTNATVPSSQVQESGTCV